jgi:hypothetical protein
MITVMMEATTGTGTTGTGTTGVATPAAAIPTAAIRVVGALVEATPAEAPLTVVGMDPPAAVTANRAATEVVMATAASVQEVLASWGTMGMGLISSVDLRFPFPRASRVCLARLTRRHPTNGKREIPATAGDA